MLNILAVDDEEDILFTIKYGFEKYNNEYEINTAKNGAECLNILSKKIPDVILLDLMMPKMNGWEVLDIILGNPNWREIPVFIITGAGNSEFKEQAEDLGITYIEKPFTIEELKNTIDSYFIKE
jgi:CheY-like chemotaxis protein